MQNSSYIRKPDHIKKYFIPIFLFVFVFGYVSFYTTQANIHGDALGNLLVPAKNIIETQSLLLHDPHQIMESSGEIIYSPLPYPQLSQLSVAIYYMIGDELILKFFSPLFAALTSIFIYLMLRKRSVFLALLVSVSVVMINSYRIVSMTPLMEQMLLFGAAASLFFYLSYIKTKQIAYLVLAGIFIGFTISIKQQGMTFGAVLIGHSFIICILELVKKKKLKVVLPFVTMVLLAIVVFLAPIGDQISRNGTIEFVPRNEATISFMQPEYIENPESIQAIQDYLSTTYWPHYDSFAQVLKSFILYPMYYFGSTNANDLLWTIILSVLIILGIVYLYQKERIVLSVLLLVLIVETILAKWVSGPLTSYHVIGLVVIAIFVAAGITKLCTTLLSLNKASTYRFLTLLVLLSLVVPMILNNVTYVHERNWQNSGRSDDIHETSYQALSSFIRDENISNEAIFLGISASFLYYCERDMIWLNPGGGAKVILIFTANDEEVALQWLSYYKIDYIFIDNAQVNRKGLGDYIPPEGLLTYIDSSSHFEEIYNDSVLRLYRVVYSGS